jgi:integrase
MRRKVWVGRWRDGYLQVNPARGVKFPQKGLVEKPAIIAGEDLARLLKHLEEPYRTMVSLIAATGLRIGELLALRWSALDLEGGALAVRESVFEGKFQPPKTVKAVRTIPPSHSTRMQHPACAPRP